jgi:hypothetical protein
MAKISPDLRSQVAARAGYRCEYCLIREADSYFGCEIDHVISLKHGGPTTYDNLSLACLACNRAKGSDLGSIVEPPFGPLVRFFNPRIDRWDVHFRITGSFIEPISPIGIVTARILEFNTEERVCERNVLLLMGHYP